MINLRTEEKTMKCIECGGKSFEERSVRLFPEIKGEEVEVMVSADVCTACSAPYMDDKQMNTYRRAAADAYRQQHGLLTSTQILGYRRMLAMSQTAFANYLKVGEASIKRWETYFVQDEGQDEHMRLKCDEAYAGLNALEVHWKSRPADLYSGNRSFSWVLFREALVRLLEATDSPLFLNKALFYADFKHFQKTGRGLTGTRYIPLEYGPCPDQYQQLIQVLIGEGTLEKGPDHRLVATRAPDLSVFDDQERETLEAVVALAKPDGGKTLLEKSHQEAAFLQTKVLDFISYEWSKELQV